MAGTDAKADGTLDLGSHPQYTADLVPSRALAVARVHGKQLLLYQPTGVLGGTFTCQHCHATAVQPDLLQHAQACSYAG